MPISEYMRSLRELIGSRPVLAPGVTAIVLNDAGHVLLQRRAEDGRWGLPGGQLEPGEAPAQAVVREVYEETGLLVRPERLLGIFGGNQNFRITYSNGDVVEYMIATFACRLVGGQLEARDGESLELQFFPADRVRELAAFEVYQCALAATRGEPPLFVWDEAWLEALEQD